MVAIIDPRVMGTGAINRNPVGHTTGPSSYRVFAAHA